MPRFRQCYNDAAHTYRKAHHIRSSSHPVPDLAEQGEWFEAPLWIYGNDSPQRKAAWARLSDDEIVISDRAGREIRVDIRYPKLAAEKLTSLMGPNLKLRPRALMTTMYARLVLSDLFLHGIGGGKYDQLGDMIMRSFFMITPPQIMVISATVQLPGLSPDSSAERIRELQRTIRDTKYQPERFADQFALDAGLATARKLSCLPKFPKRESGGNGIVNSSRSMRSFPRACASFGWSCVPTWPNSGVKRRRSRCWPVASILSVSFRSTAS